jgi:hypothetical protein
LIWNFTTNLFVLKPRLPAGHEVELRSLDVLRAENWLGEFGQELGDGAGDGEEHESGDEEPVFISQ